MCGVCVSFAFICVTQIPLKSEKKKARENVCVIVVWWMCVCVCVCVCVRVLYVCFICVYMCAMHLNFLSSAYVMRVCACVGEGE